MAEVLINGNMYNWGSITVQINGIDITTCSAISYTTTQEKENIYGIGNKPVGRGVGQITYEASITLRKEDINVLRASAPNGDLFALEFDISVVYTKDAEIVTDVVRSCEFTEDGADISQNDKMVEYEYPLIVGDIEYGL